MTWWEDTFLPSLYGRNSKGINLTAKQVKVCVDHMEAHSGNHETLYRQNVPHTWYSCTWNGRNVTLTTFPNGCGRLEFGRTEEEAEAARAEAEAEAQKAELARVERIRRNPEKLEKKLAKLRKELAEAKADLEEDFLDGDEEWVAYDRKVIAGLKEELKLYEGMA